MDTWFVSDYHFWHEKLMLIYCKRPFKTVEEMHEVMIEKRNKLVKPEDIVYDLGDVACGTSDPEKISSVLCRLNGKTTIFWGNHDKPSRRATIQKYFTDGGLEKTIRAGGYNIFLKHYPQKTWEDAMKGTIHLFGHCHGKVQGEGRSMDVGVDVWNFEPINLDTVIQKLSTLPITQTI